MKSEKWYRIPYLAISLTAFYYVGEKLISFEQWDTIDKKLITNSWGILIIIQVALWTLNIGLESLRWQTLLNSFTKANFIDALKMVITGFTTGSITPLKAGEPGGKIILLEKEERASGILVSVWGSYLNSAVLFLMASTVLPFALSAGLINLPFAIDLSWYSYIIIAAGSLGFNYVILYYFFKQIKKQVRNTRWALKPRLFNSFRPKNFLILLLYTILRVVVYNFQLYIWFIFFNVSDLGVDLLLLSPLYFAAITLIPAMFLFDLGIRGSVGIFIFSVISDNTGAILSAIFFLWFLNVAIPVLWGSLLLTSRK